MLRATAFASAVLVVTWVVLAFARPPSTVVDCVPTLLQVATAFGALPLLRDFARNGRPSVLAEVPVFVIGAKDAGYLLLW